MVKTGKKKKKHGSSVVEKGSYMVQTGLSMADNAECTEYIIL